MSHFVLRKLWPHLIKKPEAKSSGKKTLIFSHLDFRSFSALSALESHQVCSPLGSSRAICALSALHPAYMDRPVFAFCVTAGQEFHLAPKIMVKYKLKVWACQVL